VLDEATASVDLETDALNQQTVRIMVLDQGELVEFDKPQKLLANANGAFTNLCKQTGESNYPYLKKIANGEISFSEELAKQLHTCDSK
jgi:ABC-type transport system involved in cytochrome bd biosynthesis fused ATPase/permease subunit